MKLFKTLVVSFLLVSILAPTSVMSSIKRCSKKCIQECNGCNFVDESKDNGVHCDSTEHFEKYHECYRECHNREVQSQMRLGK